MRNLRAKIRTPCEGFRVIEMEFIIALAFVPSAAVAMDTKQQANANCNILGFKRVDIYRCILHFIKFASKMEFKLASLIAALFTVVF